MKFSDLISTPNSPISTPERCAALPSSAFQKDYFSRPSIVDLESGQKFWRWNLDRYLSHFKPTEPESKNKNKDYFSGPRMVDLESGQKFWRWNPDRYLSHFKPEPESNSDIKPEPESKNKNKDDFSRPGMVDLESGQKFWRWKSDRYLSHFKSTQPESKKKGSVITIRKQSPNYYSDMNAEERDEKLKSAIFYCRNSSA